MKPGKLLNFSGTNRDRRSNGNHYCQFSNLILPDYETADPAKFPSAELLIPLDTRVVGPAYNSRLSAVSTAGAAAMVSRVATGDEATFAFQWQFGDAGDEQFFVIMEYDGITPLLRGVVKQSNRFIQVFGKADYVTPVATGVVAFANGVAADVECQLNIDAGTVTLTLRNPKTWAVLDTITIVGAGTAFGDYAGGDRIGDSYIGLVEDRGIGDLSGFLAEKRYVSTGGPLPFGTQALFVQPATLVSAANGWTAEGIADYAKAVESWNSTSADNGTRCRRLSGLGTGAASDLRFSLKSFADSPLQDGRMVIGVILFLDAWTDTASSTARWQLIWNYKGVDYSLAAVAQINPFTALNGGMPQTRRLLFNAQNATTREYVGPDGLAWDLAAIQASQIAIQITTDTDNCNAGSIAVGVVYSPFAFHSPVEIDAYLSEGNGFLDTGGTTTAQVGWNSAGSVLSVRTVADYGDAADLVPATGASVVTAITRWMIQTGPATPRAISYFRITTDFAEGDSANGEDWVSWVNRINDSDVILDFPWGVAGGDLDLTVTDTGFMFGATGTERLDSIPNVINRILTTDRRLRIACKRDSEATPNGTETRRTKEHATADSGSYLQVEWKDTIAPVCTITSPAGATVATEALTIDFVGTATDNHQVFAVLWTNSAGGSGIATFAAGSWSATIDIYVGENIITFTAYDLGGNSHSDVCTVDRSRGGMDESILPCPSFPVDSIELRPVDHSEGAPLLAAKANRIREREVALDLAGMDDDELDLLIALWDGGNATCDGFWYRVPGDDVKRYWILKDPRVAINYRTAVDRGSTIILIDITPPGLPEGDRK